MCASEVADIIALSPLQKGLYSLAMTTTGVPMGFTAGIKFKGE